MARRVILDLSQRQPVPAASIPSFSPLYVTSGIIPATGTIFTPNCACTVRWFIIQVLGACTAQLLINGEPASAVYTLASGQFVRFAGRFLPNNVTVAVALTPATPAVFEVVWTKETGSAITVDQTSVFSGAPAAASPATVNQGTPNTLANGWPVELSDGTNLLGTTAHPVIIGQAAAPATYRARISGTTLAAGNSFTFCGSATKVVKIKRLKFALATTAAASVPVTMNKLSSAPTGGTSVAQVAIPLDSTDVAATATNINFYSVTNSGGAASLGALFSFNMISMGTTTILASASALLDEVFGEDVKYKPITLHGVAEGISLAISAAASLNGYIEWTEQ